MERHASCFVIIFLFYSWNVTASSVDELNDNWIWSTWKNCHAVGTCRQRYKLCINGHCEKENRNPYTQILIGCPNDQPACDWKKVIFTQNCSKEECNYIREFQCNSIKGCSKLSFIYCLTRECTGKWSKWKIWQTCPNKYKDEVFERKCVPNKDANVKKVICARDSKNPHSTTQYKIKKCNTTDILLPTTNSDFPSNVTYNPTTIHSANISEFKWKALIIAAFLALTFIVISLSICKPKIGTIKCCCSCSFKAKQAANVSVSENEEINNAEQQTVSQPNPTVEHNFYETLSRIVPSFKKNWSKSKIKTEPAYETIMESVSSSTHGNENTNFVEQPNRSVYVMPNYIPVQVDRDVPTSSCAVSDHAQLPHSSDGYLDITRIMRK